VAGDEAGVGLGLVAGGDLLVCVGDQVVPALLGEGGGVGEGDVLRGQLVVDVVLAATVPIPMSTLSIVRRCSWTTSSPAGARAGAVLSGRSSVATAI
jgi:hypothetical protein